MAKVVVFLRGINVGGIKVLMKDLTLLFQNSGFSNVKTLLASGNVIVEAEDDPLFRVQERCDEALSSHYGRTIPTLVFSAEEIEKLADPFPIVLPEPAKEHHGYLTLCDSPEAAEVLYAMAVGRADENKVALSGRAVCWVERKGQSTTSAMSKLMTSMAKQQLLTTRNHNTLVKLAAIIQ